VDHKSHGSLEVLRCPERAGLEESGSQSVVYLLASLPVGIGSRFTANYLQFGFSPRFMTVT
ncbi:hypothetical protein C7B61_14805, partial [filamentous cyanobacterium CCP1]